MIALDASALLAFLFAEPGHEQVAAQLDSSCLSCVNLAEVASRFARDGHDPRELCRRIAASPIEVVPFLAADAAIAAALVPVTRTHGLSLGDRACLALAMARNIPALTGDRAWAALQLPVPVRLLRATAQR
ncbi:MAG: type II toxin-antitoxin system VapC family toxin [Proteobacteria bacterium]|nr:type II toxin-antitoxin system VapC family toxin [Pseudomonadota bacterium]MBS0463973.1 type II toxin-antitoxin system VapC family toxin [Pseudomonadota bacterium]